MVASSGPALTGPCPCRKRVHRSRSSRRSSSEGTMPLCPRPPPSSPGRPPAQGQAESLVEAERHALGVGPFKLLLAEGGTHPVEAVPAVAGFRVLPRLSGSVQEGLRDAVKLGGPV